MPNETRTYAGTELDLFATAQQWKTYWSGQLDPYIGHRVLEVGAGLGANTRLLSGAPAVQRWLALEPDPQLAGRIRQDRAAGRLAGCCEVVAGTTADLAPGERFDTVLYLDVLEHIEDDRGELARSAGLLDSGGHMVVLAPAHPFLYSAFDRAIGHHRRYTSSGLRQLMPDGMRTVASRYLDCVGMAASLANRLLLRSEQPTPGQVALWDRAMVPASRLLDPLLGGRVGKSVLTVFRKE